ncbi:S41 family peptidase [Persicitalea sp.]|uniref:S41 family peptidase n=1 Tax=Persicitalea sp. TaxID=3100273 RepID=UPI003594610A
MKKTYFLLFLALTTSLVSCRKDKFEVVRAGNPADTEVNNWIHANMKQWYFWNDKLPESPDFKPDPQTFFQSLLYKFDPSLRPDGDRFSWLQESAAELKASLSGESTTTGLEYRMIRYVTGQDDLFGVVTYVDKGSSAEKAGFKRGDFFTHINGQKLSVGNYRALLTTGNEAKVITLGTLDADKKVVSTSTTRSATPGVIQSNPVYFDTTFVKGEKRVGYVVYHQFIPGPNGSNAKTYDQELEKIFADFKAKGVNELVMDLRYNRGGYVSSATQIASLVGKGVSDKDVFYYKEYNKTVTPDLEKQYGKDFFHDNFLSKSQNLGGSLNRVFFLTSTSSASASELLINGLKPFMEVFLVGGKTVGKNVGSITLSDKTNRIKWGIQPIVSRSSNSQRSSDYTAGFEPNVVKTEGTLLYPYGDPHDPLLGEALFQIFGTRVARRGLDESEEQPKVGPEVYSSIDRKAAGGNMFFTLPNQ